MDALELRKAGRTYREIGKEIGVSHEAARKLVERGMQALRDLSKESCEEWRALETERLDALWAGLWPSASTGDTQAVSQALRVMERRAKLLGLDLAGKEQADQLANAISGLHFMGLEDNEPPPG